jgi:hypothetical protein
MVALTSNSAFFVRPHLHRLEDSRVFILLVRLRE